MLLHPPDTFVEQLRLDCPHLRVRWSPRRAMWQIEQQVGRAALLPIRIEEGDDSLRRSCDGYALVMEVAPSDRVSCPRCCLPITLPHLETREVPCAYCRSRGIDTTVIAGYWPLGEALLQHLRRTNPFRQTREGDAIDVQRAAADHANERAADIEQKDYSQLHQDLWFDALTSQIPQVSVAGPSV